MAPAPDRLPPVRRPLALAAAVLLALAALPRRQGATASAVPGPQRSARRRPSTGRAREARCSSTATRAAARLGSFEWEAGRVVDGVARPRLAARCTPPSATASASSPPASSRRRRDVDPGPGPGSETGRSVVWAGGTTFARARHRRSGSAPPTAAATRAASATRASGSRRRRGAPRPRARLRPAGEATALGRPARRFTLSFARRCAPRRRRAAAGPVRPTPDTRARVAFLEDAVPVALDGELLVDARTGAPLRGADRGAFGVPSIRRCAPTSSSTRR